MPPVEILTLLREAQRMFNDEILARLEIIRQEHAMLAYGGLMLLGFLYGALHAIGPGHGKVVVSSYLLANEKSLKRGLIVVALSALIQAVTAILLVVGFYSILHFTKSEAEGAAAWLENASACLIGLLGAWLSIQGARSLWQLWFPRGSHTHHHDHAHKDHVHDSCCGHAHGPSAQQLEKKQDTASLLAMIVSIGIRPCTGALLLLFFSVALDLLWPGILATFAMAVGTALTTAALAILTVTSKALALKLVKGSGRGLAIAHGILRLLGGIAIMLLAVFFLSSESLMTTPQGPARHPLFHSRE